MTARSHLSPDILAQHVAVLGKTGSGKTSTAKLAIEQVVAQGARVCVLDPIKSDWWGLTSSADGRRAGLPFHILGGPHGHVPLHASAGKAIAEIVANGSLPLSIVDMADFEPGGQAKFFVEFAPALLRKMRGVVYLVIEEAHLFAPKERSGIGNENLSIHWAKTMATAGRSKGIRLVLVTQRTQALHNALLGSCDTLIAHRLTAPADQDPVVKWLKANTSKDILEQVAGSLASLKTGEGWICAGEARRFERVHFPRVHTYDNTATPTGEGETREIKTAPVDQEKLRAIIGDAVEQAKADDPRELRKLLVDRNKRISELEQQSTRKLQVDKVVAKPVLTDADRALLDKNWNRIFELSNQLNTRTSELVAGVELKLGELMLSLQADLLKEQERTRAEFERRLAAKGFQKILDKLATLPTPIHPTTHAAPRSPQARRVDPAPSASRPARLVSTDGQELGKGERVVLTAVAQYPAGVTREQLTILTGYTRSSRNTYLQRLGASGFVQSSSDVVVATEAGVAALGDFEPLPTGDALLRYWLARLTGGEQVILAELAKRYPDVVDRESLSETTGYTRSSRNTYLQRLGARKLIVNARDGVQAAQELFS